MKFGHIALRIKDLEKMLFFYINGLGMQEAFRINNDDGSLRIVYLHIAGGDMLELCLGGKEKPDFDDKSDIGFRHLSLVVDDLAKTKSDLEAKGILCDSEILILRDNNKTCFLFDPDGNKVELVEIATNSPHYQFLSKL